MNQYNTPNDIRVGVIGYGGAFNMGRQHLEQMRKAGMKPAAVVEIDQARLDVARDEFPGIETYTNVKTMLANSDVDLLAIITPHNTHAKLATQCLKAGRHVVCEKPFAITTAECDRMIRAAEANDVMVSTYHNRHWDGCALRAVQQIREKRILGDLFRVECHMGGYGKPGSWWRSSKSISGGILYDWGVHLLEYALQVIDAPIVEVSGFAVTGYWDQHQPSDFPWRGDANEDDAFAAVRFENGVLLTLNISSLMSAQRPGIIEFFGAKGAYEMHHHNWTTRVAGRDGLVEKTGENPKSRGELYYKNVAEYLTGKAELVITPQWARRPIHILDLADRSARRNRALKAKYS